ncbi:MAG TPA: hypothetical protein PKO06_07460, partial [Candidatus Ozemobacteraceae bacterium]|nr:hypothetical protein [Candidatus Ozemobacteraceae bacterium]
MPRDQVYARMASVQREQYLQFTVKHRLANGEVRPVEVSCSLQFFQGRELLHSIIHDISERCRVEQEREHLIQELQCAVAKIKTLRGMLPICAACKKVRDDKGYWNQIEAFLSEFSELEFSHGICPDCKKRLYPDLED